MGAMFIVIPPPASGQSIFNDRLRSSLTGKTNATSVVGSKPQVSLIGKNSDQPLVGSKPAQVISGVF
jgi:hypothetical protein